MATLAGDPLGQEMFELWHYEDLHSYPTAVEDLFDVPWQDGPLFCDLHGTEAYQMAGEQVYVLVTREYMQLSIFVVAEGDFHGLRALFLSQDWISAQHIRGWDPHPPVLFWKNTTTNHRQQGTNGLTIGANIHHSAYMHQAVFIRARHLLMCDLDKSLDEAA
jgi:hypothetical protein